MEWFKHKTGSLDDPDFNLILDEFGSDGYMMFFGLLEIYGKEYSNVDTNGFLHINSGFVARKLRKSSAKVQKFLNFCQKNLNKTPWEYSLSGKIISYKVPRFIDLSSNWTKRQHNKPTEAPTEAPPKKHHTEEEVEEEVRSKKKNKDIHGQMKVDFDLFWKHYPKKVSKGQARKTWDKLYKTILPSVEIIVAKLEQLKQSDSWLKDGGQYIPNPSTWLNAEGWEDEPQEYRPDLQPKSISEAERLEERMRGPRLQQEADNEKQSLIDKRDQDSDRPAIPLLPETDI